MEENKNKIPRLLLFWVIVILIGLVVAFFWWARAFSFGSTTGLFGPRSLFSPLWMPLVWNKFLYVMLLLLWSPFLQVFLFCLIWKLLIGKQKTGQIIRQVVIYEAVISPYIPLGIIFLIISFY